MLYYLINSEINKISATFRIGGPDANTYLQGQFTQDLNRASCTASYGLFLNTKGKVLADGYVMRCGPTDFWLVSFALAAPKLLDRLENYLIADEVTIEDETNAWTRLSLWGEGAEAAVTKVLGGAPSPGSWVEAQNIRIFCGRRSSTANFELMVPNIAAPGICGQLRDWGAIEADFGEAERERISSGIPAVPEDIGPNDLPNEGGLDEVAISYTKGCYLGQEVMARLKNLGQVRRRLYVVGGGGQRPAPGSLLYQGDQKVGEVRSIASDGNAFVAMAMLSLVNLDQSRDLDPLPGGTTNIKVIRRV